MVDIVRCLRTAHVVTGQVLSCVIPPRPPRLSQWLSATAVTKRIATLVNRFFRTMAVEVPSTTVDHFSAPTSAHLHSDTPVFVVCV
jgi:hypothetical protein